MSEILDSALRITAFGPQFKNVLRNKLKLKGYEDPEITEVIQKLEDLEILDDEKVATLYTSSLVRNKFTGPNLVRAKLYEKGVEKEIIENVINKIYEENDGELEVCKNHINKYIDNKTLDDKPKLYRKLQSKGFNFNIIKKSLRQY